MARAKRHYLPGQIWHITHRCHQREFLLKLKLDQRRWVHWLYKAKKKYGLVILNYTVTSNHIHLLVQDNDGRDTIPHSMKLVAGRTAQEFNSRKKRKGSFWEDRYHATAVESEHHLFQCLMYIDLNMVRAGVVSHPSQWMFCGYNEIQQPRRKKILIAYPELAELAGFDTYGRFKEAHQELVNASLKNGDNSRHDFWSQSVAVGSEGFVETIKKKLGYRAKGRKVVGHGDGFQLREQMASYIADSDGEKGCIDDYNTYLWNDKYEFTSS